MVGPRKNKKPLEMTTCILHPEVIHSVNSVCRKCSYRVKEDANREELLKYRRGWVDANRSEVNRKSRERNYLKKFGVSPSDLAYILEAQEGVCNICRSETVVNTLHLDHCHTTGKVRGLLCQKCNQALGMFKDDIGLLEIAIEYLDRNNLEGEYDPTVFLEASE